LEQNPSHRFSFQQHAKLVDAITIDIVVRQTQLVIQGVWPSIHVMGIIEQPLVQRNILVTTPQPTIEIALTYAYYQHVGHEFKNCPFVDDKLKQLMREKLITSLLPITMSTPTI
jgi:hypothetical protein